MNKPHKHAELIKAWADGAEIQYRSNAQDDWVSTQTPEWNGLVEYRIKPAEKVVRWQWILKDRPGLSPWVSIYFLKDEAEVLERYGGSIILGKAEWTRMEFDE